LVLIACLAGCKREDIRVYDIPAQKAVQTPGLPQGWQELPGGQMKVGNYSIEGRDGAKAQVTIIPLPGAAGNELNNVNRWRGQIGLPPIKSEDLNQAATEVKVAGEPARLFEVSGVAPQTDGTTRILAALQNRGDSVWFFKMMGNDGLVKEQKDTFLSFLDHYQYPDAGRGELPAVPTTAQTTPATQERNGDTPKRELQPGTQPSPAKPDGSRWNSPAGWEPQQPGPMQDAKFLVAGGKASVSISIFDGPAGGLLPNVNRWRGQLGLPAITEKALAPLLAPLDLPDTKAKLVDMTGATERMVAAIVPRDEKTWYFKLLGETVAVASEKDTFLKFVKSAK
jgi:hypothetical protein